MNEFFIAPRPIRAVLIANRGEIACRVTQTCRKLGLRSIAIYSEADSGARHVRLADEAILIGPAAPAQSYLSIEAVIAAALASGADAIHPGYGFLSENAGFVRACGEANVIFIGPSAEAVATMGSKIEAKHVAQKAGVPVVPGYQMEKATLADLTTAAEKLGYPVMVKASAGGGGRGLRRVSGPPDLWAAISSAQAEAQTAFGDDTIFLEKLIDAPRHLEVQVFGDGKGGALHFFERDCSIQRNHQKLVEEAPAPNLSDAVRQKLLDNAVLLTRAINYSGAGTVEFIMQAGSESPYFLEMNTRIQVEHPVTEKICGVDLVELQIRHAAGLSLGLSQDEIRCNGHAIEVRLNAERPDNGFLPETGRLVDVVRPPGLRFDSGVEAGSEVGMHYDSLLAKLISHGPNRESARRRLIAGLDELAMPGVMTNQAFLRECLEVCDYVRGEATTSFLEDHFPRGWKPDRTSLLRLRAQAVMEGLSGTAADPLQRGDGFRVTAPCRFATVPLLVTDGYGMAEITLELGAARLARSEGEEIVIDEASRPLIWREHAHLHAAKAGLALCLTARPLAEARLDNRTAGSQPGLITAPLTGLVSHVYVAAGDSVSAGDALVEMQAMKLVHSLKAPFDGRVVSVSCAAGETINSGSILVEMEEG